MATRKKVIPDELLWMIVERVHDRGTLYSMLTSGKRVFGPAVEKLWRDPFGYNFRDKGDFILLIKCLLVLSHSQHSAITALRSLFKVALVQVKKPYVDYLALVRHARPRYQEFWTPVRNVMKLIVCAAPWIICNGRFNQLSTILILPGTVKDYLTAIPTMTQMTKVVWMMGYHVNDTSLVEIRQFVEAFVVEHGNRGRQLLMEFSGWQQSGVYMDVFPDVQLAVAINLFRLLAPFPPGKTVIRGMFDWARCLAHRDETDFSQVRVVATEIDDQVGALLPSCPKLEDLSAWELVWASSVLEPFSEAGRRRDRQSKEGSLKIATPLFVNPPLRHVHFTIPSHELPVFMEGLSSNFGSTLQDIYLELDYNDTLLDALDSHSLDANEDFSFFDDGNIVIHLQSERWSFPNLTDFTVTDYSIDNIHLFIHGDMGGMPKLEELSIRGATPTLPPNLGQNHVCETWKLPQLQKLELEESMAIRFNPKSLHHSPKLRQLELSMSSLFSTMVSGIHPPNLWKNAVASSASSETPPTSLTDVTLTGYAALCLGLEHVKAFMPHVKNLKLTTGNSTLEDEQNLALRDFVFDKERNALLALQARIGVAIPATPCKKLDALVDLEIRGLWTLDATDYRNLFRDSWAPCLQSLTIDYTSIELLSWAVTIACQHPTLQRVHFKQLIGDVDEAKIKSVKQSLGIAWADSDKHKGDASYIFFELPFSQGYKQRSASFVKYYF